MMVVIAGDGSDGELFLILASKIYNNDSCEHFIYRYEHIYIYIYTYINIYTHR